jgi:glycosyltransferase involved in cell wall biosynthesis
MTLNNSNHTDDIWCVIPTFNNKNTIKDIALECRKYLEHVIVVDDGSTDCDVSSMLSATDIVVLRHHKNFGKGKAMRTALDYIVACGGQFMITIDADGQHYPQDVNKFIPILRENPATIVIGCRDFKQESIPGKSKFGRAFSNFWISLETGIIVNDSQSGFRAYPVKYISKMHLSGDYYDFEAEVLTRGVWAGLSLKEVPINVFYPEASLRVSSFRPIKDNFRISCMHLKLIGRRLIPIPYPRVVPSEFRIDYKKIIKHPILFLKELLAENATPLGLAIAAGVGMFLGVLPIIAGHIIVTIYVSERLHLNIVMAVAIQNLCMPPLMPIVCIELGHFMLHKKWLTDINWHTVFGAIHLRIWEWFLGSLVIAPIMAVITGVAVYFITRAVRNKKISHARNS